MLVYTSTKNKFIDDVRTNRIDEIVESEVLRKLKHKTGTSEVLSWKHSLQYMMNVLMDPEIPASAGVAIEYKIPRTNNRIDFILTGKDSKREEYAIVIELKQWAEAEKTQKDAIVKTFIGGAIRETNHPSYQAWSYASLITEFNKTVRDEQINLKPCAYLHNMKNGASINDGFYSDHIDKAPVFLSPDAEKLAGFLKRFIKHGDSNDIMYRIEHGVIKPSKNLADSLASMIDGNQEFIMIDDQKLVYETAVDLAHKANAGAKQTLIVKGGPGTGKSVVAVNLLVELTKRGRVAQYVSKNAAPRAVFSSLLKGTRTKSIIDSMFKGSGSYINVEANSIDALIVDEAHRLNEKSGLYSNLGEDQIKELTSSSKLSIFFIDEAQRVTFQDIGSVNKIKEWAKKLNSTVTELELFSQFRCNGSDGYLSWVDNTLDVRETANETLDGIDYEVKVFDDPNELRKEIIDKNRNTNKARMVAGYCWDWKSKKVPEEYDIVIPNYSFNARWNLTSDGSLWMISEKSVHEVGCIHTSQGLELDYIGVIFGEDFVIRDGEIITDGAKRSSYDRSVRGYKKMLKEFPQEAKQLVDEIIKNTYRTLMTRGQKGCYIFSVDEETNQYFKNSARRIENEPIKPEQSYYSGLPYPVIPFENVKPYQGYVPIFNLEAAAGSFSDSQYVDECSWLELPDHFVTAEGMFVIKVIGESMNRRIPNGSWCLFKANPGGSRNSKVVLVEHRTIEDPDHGGSYTVKVYHSDKSFEEGESVNYKITLKPDTNAFGYEAIVINEADEGFNIIGEFIAVL